MELKKRDPARVLTEMVDHGRIYPLKIWSVHVVVMQELRRHVQKKHAARAELLFCSLNLLLF